MTGYIMKWLGTQTGKFSVKVSTRENNADKLNGKRIVETSRKWVVNCMNSVVFQPKSCHRILVNIKGLMS